MTNKTVGLVPSDAHLLLERFQLQDLDQCGDRLALRIRVGPSSSHRDLTFRELAVKIKAVADNLRIWGCTPGGRLALLMPHSEDLIVSFLASIYGGLIPSIVAWPTSKMDSEKYQRNLRSVLTSLAADWLVTDDSSSERLRGALGRTRVLSPSVVEGGFAPAGARAMESRGRLAFIQFSGGTTGAQKSVPVTLDLLATQLSAYSNALDLGQDDRFISWLPLYHDMGLVACLLLPFVARLPVTVFSPMEWVMDPRPFLQAIGSDRATLCWLPNFAFSFLAKRTRLPPASLDLASLRAVVSCSEPVRAESLEAFATRFASDGLRREALHACYAMAEAAFAVATTNDSVRPLRLDVSVQALGCGQVAVGPAPTRTLVSCGKPIAGFEVRIVDDSGKDQPPDRLGEIWLRGRSLMESYLDRPRAEAFTGDWYRTGDLGFMRDGHLFVTGRKKDVVIVGGVNVYPEDVEAAVNEVGGIHPGRTVAMGIANEELGTENLVLVAEVSEETDLARARRIEDSVRAAVVAMIGVAPAKIFLVPPKWIVKSTAGKISRAETRARVLSRWTELTQGRAVSQRQ